MAHPGNRDGILGSRCVLDASDAGDNSGSSNAIRLQCFLAYSILPPRTVEYLH
jgi:hypothetical protein